MNKIVKIVLISLAICFLTPIIFTFVTFADDNSKNDLLENGTKTTATVVDYECKKTINDIDYYSLKYEFLDENGNTHVGYSSPSFEYYEAISTNELTIYYDKNYNSAELGQSSDTAKYLILGIFSLFDIILWIAVITVFIIGATNKDVLKYGTEKTATFVDYKTYLTINEVPAYAITYEFTDKNGQTKKNKSTCKYTLDEANYLRSKKKFDIKEYKGKSVIIEKLDLSTIDEYNKKLQASTSNGNQHYFDNSIKKMKRCVYCKSLISIDEGKCPYCGGNEFENEEE